MDIRATPYFQIFRETYRLMKNALSGFEDTEPFWERLVDEADQIDKRYAGMPEQHFAQQLVLGVTAEIERLNKRK